MKNHTLSGDSVMKKYTLGGDSILKKHTLNGDSIHFSLLGTVRDV